MHLHRNKQKNIFGTSSSFFTLLQMKNDDCQASGFFSFLVDPTNVYLLRKHETDSFSSINSFFQDSVERFGSGEYHGHQLFPCKKNHGLILPVDDVLSEEHFEGGDEEEEEYQVADKSGELKGLRHVSKYTARQSVIGNMRKYQSTDIDFAKRVSWT